MIELSVNQITYQLDCDEGTPLLWALRDHLQLTGTKFGCGSALCGACTVRADGLAIRACVTPVKEVVGKNIQTIEGLKLRGDLHPVQEAWLKEGVAQCGYCQAGQIMSAAALVEAKDGNVSERDIDVAMSSNICRCGTYPKIKKAIAHACDLYKKG